MPARGVTSSAAPHTPFSTGGTIGTDQANYDGSRTYGSGAKGVNRGKTLDVGSFKPNAFGLFDMHGNVWEWVQDCYKENYTSASALSPCFPALRGGGWFNDPRSLRSAERSWKNHDNRNSRHRLPCCQNPLTSSANCHEATASIMRSAASLAAPIAFSLASSAALACWRRPDRQVARPAAVRRREPAARRQSYRTSAR